MGTGPEGTCTRFIGSDMETKQKKIINHKFLNKHTIPGAILLMLWGLIFTEMIFGLPFVILDTIFVDQSGKTQLFSGFGCAAGAFLLLAIHKRWFYPEFEGCLKCSSVSFADAFKPAAAIIPFWILSCIKELAFGSKFSVPTLAMISTSLMAGCCEEASFRGLGISYLMRQWKEENKVLPALLFTSAGFGLVHSANILSGAEVPITLIQTFSSFFIGLFLGAIFLRSGNLWPAMIIHFLHDVFAGMFLSEGYVLTHAVGWIDAVDLTLCLLLGIAGIYLIRPEKRAEIIEIWKRKWSMDQNFTKK